jgi:predicted nucleic acid-binding protein
LIYLDSSVVLARIFIETRSPPDVFWSQRLVSSWLLRYEVMNRVHVRAPRTGLADDAERILDRVELIDLAATVLDRALAPFPVQVRTLDSLHLATIDYLRRHGQKLQLATYDQRLAVVATALGFPLAAL